MRNVGQPCGLVKCPIYPNRIKRGLLRFATLLRLDDAIVRRKHGQASTGAILAPNCPFKYPTHRSAVLLALSLAIGSARAWIDGRKKMSSRTAIQQRTLVCVAAGLAWLVSADSWLVSADSYRGIPVAPENPATRPASPSGASKGEVDTLAMWDDNRNGQVTCAEARRHGIAPVPRGHPAYRYMRDGDGDGVVCE